MDLTFKKVIPTDNQIEQLFLFLKERKHSISHEELPTKDSHISFVRNNPYLVWYLVYKEKLLICSVYIQKDNSIGINIKEGYENYFINIISYIKSNHKPLPELKSVRKGSFFVNIPTGNKNLLEILTEPNFKELKRSFSI